MVTSHGANARADAAPNAGDLGPLAWVLDETRKSIESATRSLKRFAHDAEAARGVDIASVDASQLRIARQQLHQAVGALDMVAQPVAARMVRGMELAVQQFVARPEKCSDAAAITLERAGFALIEYLESRLSERARSAIGLFPQFRQVQEIALADRIHPADLWEREWRWVDPATPAATQAISYSPEIRARMDQRVLKIMRHSDANAAAELGTICLALARGEHAPHPVIFWKLSAGFLEALGKSLLPMDVYTRRAASRVLLQYASLAGGDKTVSERLALDLLFFCAQAAPRAGVTVPVLTAVRRAWGLDEQHSVDYERPTFGLYDPAVLAQARRRVEAIKENWSALAGGDLARLKACVDQFGLVAESLDKLYAPAKPLSEALNRVAVQLAQSGRAPSDELAMETATAVLFLEASFADFRPADAMVTSRMQQLAQRLDAVRAGAAAPALESWMEELYRSVSDRQTLGMVVSELRSTLGEVEQHLDQFFRHPDDPSVLNPVPALMSQMRGVLSVLGLDQAALAIARLRGTVDELLASGADAGRIEASGAFERLGNSLGALGFQIDMLGYQPLLARKLFVYDAESGELRHRSGRVVPDSAHGGLDAPRESTLDFELDLDARSVPHSQPAALIDDSLPPETLPGQLEQIATHAALDDKPALAHAANLAADVARQQDPALLSQALDNLHAVAAVETVTVEPVTAAAADDTDDDDLRGIFLEEAREVVQTGTAALLALADAPGDPEQQTTLRRAFHTLKGSSRMVGLSEFGEAAWSMEQLLNAWLAEQKPFSDDLRGLAGEAMQALSAWIDAIVARSDTAWQAAPFRAAADALRTQGVRLALAAAPCAQPWSGGSDEAPGDSAGGLSAEPTGQGLLESAAAASVVDVVLDDASFVVGVDPGESPVSASSDALPLPKPLAALELPDLELPAAPADGAAAAFVDSLTAFDPVGADHVVPTSAQRPESAAEHVVVPAAQPRPGLDTLEFDLAALEGAADSVGALGVVEASPSSAEGAARLDGVDVAEATDRPWAESSADARVLASELAEAPIAVEDSPALDVVLDGDLLALDLPELDFAVADAVQPAAMPLEMPAADDESYKQIGDLRISVPLYNVYLNEADEWSRQLITELSEWALEPDQPVPERAVARAHSLAGSSATVGFSALSELARAVEHALQRLHGQARASAEQTRVLGEAAEDIRRVLHQFAAGLLKAPDASILAAVNRLEAVEVSATQEAAAQACEGIDSAAETAVEAGMGVSAASALAPREGGGLRAATEAFGPRQSIGDDIDVADAVDPDLFPIFEEEAGELLPQLGGALRQWVGHPDDRAARAQVLRALHTLKGSARLAGALRLGEMAHRTESAIEAIGTERIGADDLDPLLDHLDELQAGFRKLQVADARVAGVEAVVPVPAAPSQVLHAVLPDSSASADPLPPQAPVARGDVALPAPLSMVGARAAASQAVRVRSQLLDRLVTQAGEVITSRARMEAEVGRLRGALNELTGNLERLRQQLRDVELQAETQMQSRLALSKDAQQNFDPLEFDRFTRMQELTRMMAESVNDVATVQRTLQRAVEGSEDDLAAQARQSRELQRDLLRTRMVEFEGIAERLYRVVRQASKETGKQVRLDVTGGSIEMDRGILERMTPVFEHLLRNCVVHGVESQDVRAACGKDPVGLISIGVQQAGNDVAVEFRDDGAGLNLARIRARALQQNLIAPEQDVGEAELADLIFRPGFSTATEVTELAGRGVGMDVVRSEVQALGGRIETSSREGQGSSFRLVLPLTTAVTHVVMIRSGGLSVGVPSSLVETVQRATAQELAACYASGEYRYGEQVLPFFWSGALLQSSARSTQPPGRTTPVVVFRSADQRVAVHVDEVLGNQEVVVKALGPQLSRLPGLVAMTALASGAVALIYNPVVLSSVFGEQARALVAQPLAAEPVTQAGGDKPDAGAVPRSDIPLVLVVDDSITVRRVTQRLLQREGYRVALAADGLQGLERVQAERPAVILSDIEMPRMDGFDFVRNLRADESLRELPVIMITSRIAEKHREHARQLGVNHYLGKPYSEDELLRLVRDYARAGTVSALA